MVTQTENQRGCNLKFHFHSKMEETSRRAQLSNENGPRMAPFLQGKECKWSGENSQPAPAGVTHPQGQLMWTKAPNVSQFQTASCGGQSPVVVDGPSEIPEEK